ncbi:BT_3987 domain-containing protein [Flavobacterium sp. MAHUQ-51]|uniref:BT_3987 domain-containing protein n=1 Tax=Flavobacterium sp. GCM10022190 TaxID=3252639 RepID=UPI0036160725
MKKIIYFKYLFCTITLFGLLMACNENEDTNKGDNGIFIVPSAKEATESKVLLSFVTSPYKYPVAVAVKAPVSTSTDVTIDLDNNQVAAYNTAHKTNYSVMPEGSYSLEATNLTIPVDSNASQQTNLVVKAGMLNLDTDYLLPIKVASVSASDIVIDPAMATKYYIFRVPTPNRGNLSNGKTASWKNPSASFNAQRAVDGNTNGDWGGGSVCESGAAAEQYWQVDLGAISPLIDDVKIWNRTDCCDDRTINFYVFISEVPFTGASVAESLAQPGVKAFYTAGKAGRPTQILTSVSGRYIRVQNTGGQSLTLAEVTATGIRP